jgi:heptaprenyl diphosphate synthase
MEKNKLPVRELTLFAILLSIGLVLHYLESFFCIYVGSFMLKMGLSNIVILFYIIQKKPKEALLMAFCKLLLALLFSPSLNLSNLMISLGGTVASLITMIIFSIATNYKIIPVSIAGGIFHNLGQLGAVLFLVSIPLSIYQVSYFFPILVILGTVTGFIVGSLTKIILTKLKFIPKKSDYNNR